MEAELETSTYYILALEDDEPMRRLIARELGKLGAQVTTVATPDEALCAARADAFDLAVLDIALRGHEFNGIDVGRALAAQWGTPIIFVSGHDDLALVQAAAQAGPRGYLVKPFAPEQLRAAAQAALSGAPTYAERDRLIADALDAVGLSSAKHTVARLLEVRASDDMIARQLDVSMQTARTYARDVLKKLGLHSRAQVAAWLAQAAATRWAAPPPARAAHARQPAARGA